MNVTVINSMMFNSLKAVLIFWLFVNFNRGLLFTFSEDDVDFLFWRFAWCWPTWRTSSLLGSSSVRRLNLFDVLIWQPMSLPSFAGFLRFARSFCKGQLNLSEHLLFRFWKLPHLQGQMLILLLPELYVFSANILIIRFFDDISSFKYLISFFKFVQQFLLSSEFILSILFLTSNNFLSSSQTGLRALKFPT